MKSWLGNMLDTLKVITITLLTEVITLLFITFSNNQVKSCRGVAKSFTLFDGGWGKNSSFGEHLTVLMIWTLTKIYLTT